MKTRFLALLLSAILSQSAFADMLDWRPQNSGTTEFLCGVAFADTANGWVVGGHGTILHTTDGGKSWIPQNSGTTDELGSVTCASASIAWTVGGRQGLVLHTSDAGKTWERQFKKMNEYRMNEVVCTDSRHAWIGWNGYNASENILRTSDAGAKWSKLKIKGLPLYSGTLAFADTLHGWVISLCANPLGSKPFYTANGGKSWEGGWFKTDTSFCVLCDITDVCVVDTVTAFAVGHGGWIFSTGNLSPRGFDAQYSGETVDFEAVHFVDHKRGWVVGEKGTILTTTDGGNTWLPDYGMPEELTLMSVYFVDQDHGWAVGSNGTILHYGK